MKKTKILAIAHAAQLQLFGSERSFVNACSAMASPVTEVVVALPPQFNPTYRAELAQFSSVIEARSTDRWSNGLFLDRFTINEFAFLIWKHNIDCVYTNTVLTRSGAYAGKLLSRPVVTHVRELVDQDESLQKDIDLTAEEIINDIDKRSTIVVANSRTTAVMLNKFIDVKRIVCIPNGIDTERFRDIRATDNAIIKVGLISSNSRKKGISDFVKIAQWCFRHSVSAEFHLIGPINDRVKMLQDRLRTGEVAARLVIRGYVPDSVEAIKDMDVILSLSSFGESFGRSVAEAMAAGRVVIGYSAGALPEIINHGLNGFLVDQGDFRAVGQLIKQIALQPDNFAAVRTSAQKSIEDNYGLAQFNTAVANLISGIQATDQIRAPTPRRNLCVVITVYNAFEHVEQCLASVLSTIDLECARVIIVDDGSTDERIQQFLQNKSSTKLNVISLSSNIGYTSAVNIGLMAAIDDDVVILNSDTIVTKGWLESLVAAAYSDPKIGTVTPISNNAGAFSFPEWPIDLVNSDRDVLADFATSVLAALSQEDLLDLPTGSGFCMFVKRDLINSIGVMNSAAFPKGYGEENDFCQRAMKSGWRNVISPWAYVFHSRSASFGDQRITLTEQARDIINSLHPNYFSDVKSTFKQPTIAKWKKRSEEATERFRAALTM